VTFAAGIFIGFVIGACFGAVMMAVVRAGAEEPSVKRRRPH
jgi:hypothetical protein